jgi:SAM-dependent methyltransferase
MASASDSRLPTVPDYDEVWREVYGEMQERGPVHRHMRRILGNILSGLDYRSVVDVGCGAGDNFPLLVGHGSLDRLAGVDVSAEALDRARSRGSADLHQLDIESAALDERFDLVFSSLVLEHLPDDVAALRNMRTMTGRHLLVTTIAGDFERYRPWDEQMGHVRNYRRGELEQKLELAGFEPVRMVYWGFPLYSPVVRRLQNRATSEPSFGALERVAASVLYGLYFLNSSRRGDLLIALARPRSGELDSPRIESSSEHRGA